MSTTDTRSKAEILADERVAKREQALANAKFKRRRHDYIAKVSILDDAIREAADDTQVRLACEEFNKAVAMLMAVRPEPSTQTMIVSEH